MTTLIVFVLMACGASFALGYLLGRFDEHRLRLTALGDGVEDDEP